MNIPTIGIGAGVGCSGQVLVFHDLVGLYPNFVPKFAKQYIQIAQPIEQALKEFKKEVENREFPTLAHSYNISQEELTNAFPDYSFVVTAQPLTPHIPSIIDKSVPSIKENSPTVIKTINYQQ